jgi:hypothetical protein
MSTLFLVFAALVLYSAPSRAAILEVINEKTESHVASPGTNAFFIPPQGLALSSRFSGFESPERGIEVIAVNIAAPFADIEAGFSEASFRSRGMEMKSRGELIINGRKAVLFKVLHPDGTAYWGKWIMLAENGSNTLVVNAVFVSGDAKAAGDLETMLKGTFLEADAQSAASSGSTGGQDVIAALPAEDVPVSSDAGPGGIDDRSTSPDERPIISSSADDRLRRYAPLFAPISPDVTEPAGTDAASLQVSSDIVPSAGGFDDGFDKEAALRSLAGKGAVSGDAVFPPENGEGDIPSEFASGGAPASEDAPGAGQREDDGEK